MSTALVSGASTYETSPPIPSQELLDRNAKSAESHKIRVSLHDNWEKFPRNAIITCMDSRVHPHKQLGLADHDTTIIRNTSGRVTELIDTILTSHYKGTRHFMLIKHTDCGGFYTTGPKFKEHFKAHTKNPDALDSLPAYSASDKRGFGDATIEQVVLSDVEYLRNSPLIFEETTISGWVFDDNTGKVRGLWLIFQGCYELLIVFWIDLTGRLKEFAAFTMIHGIRNYGQTMEEELDKGKSNDSREM
ncbi:hypothetical protein D9758_014779 [Tetrapyrgos nigripes]|uniref:Carbonic anhydrase n=1 Tax=Tetrapyrgos nigripes TaxID=182062 RepID=A0A8H5FG60_9AGAR|nr:hypothetical protein D9758_014779 [Tetrapyrgos nigripes]